MANRLGGACFELDGKLYRLPANDNGNTLHGGNLGFDRVMWTVKEVRPDSIMFQLRDPDGQEGWPGNLDVKMRYTLTEDNSFKVEYEAVTDAPTLCNLTHHTFFNLTGDASRSILNHVLQIDAPSYIPVDEKLIPTGEVRNVEGTPFDFNEGKPIGKDIDASGGYDHNWCLASGGGVRKVARLTEPMSGRIMDILTDQSGLQFYSGNFFDGSYAGKDGRIIGHRCALALETQAWPDAIHHPGFSDTVLRSGQTYTHTCIYRFSI
jgi:aldose 1-epimerase